MSRTYIGKTIDGTRIVLDKEPEWYRVKANLLGKDTTLYEHWKEDMALAHAIHLVGDDGKLAPAFRRR